jgi:hypothetical protein
LIQTQDFIEIIEDMIKRKVYIPFSLGRIDPFYSGGKPRVIFDGENKPSYKRYTHLSSYKPVANDRVLMANIAGTHVILGSIGEYRGPISGGGSNGVGLQYTWNGTALGVKREDETTFQYVELAGGLGNRETTWTNITLGAGWSNYGSPYQVAQYKRDVSNFVNLRGLIKGGTTGTLFTLPTGFRPKATEIFYAPDTSLIGVNDTYSKIMSQRGIRIDIKSTGEVSIQSVGSNGWVSLSGIRFSID